MITVLAPCDLNKVVIVPGGSYADHIARKGYSRDYAGNDLARAVKEELTLRPSQWNGKVLQSMWSTIGYGNTTFVEYGGILRVRNAHQKNLGVKVGDIVNPSDYLGTMDSTGNSTGDHTHWEVWLKRDGAWHNVDPYDPRNGVKIVNNVADLQPLDGETPVVTPPAAPPVPENLAFVRTTKIVTTWINIRALPRVNSLDLGDMRPGEIWEFVKKYQDPAGNIWYAVIGGETIGWAAAYYQGQTWIEEAK